MPSAICNSCSQIFTTNDKHFHPHHRSAQELLACPCSLCKHLCDGLRNSGCSVDELLDPEDVAFMDFHYHIGLDGNTLGSPPTILFVVKYPNMPKVKGVWPASEMFFHQKIFIVKSDEKDAPRGLPSNSTRSPEAWNSAVHWIDTCLKTHSKCLRRAQPKWVPTRLLDVGVEENPAAFLRIMEPNCPRHPYTTLSHCWGKNPNFKKLLQENLENFSQGIRISELTKTFQDAITITRMLGVRYLWIDSLCIIQEDDPDWLKESSMMGDVYQNGYCNIAATAAEDGFGGCFVGRDPVLAQKCRVRLERPLSKFNLNPGLYDLVPRSLWEHGVTNAPLNRRAWVAQERILAPRVLHFGCHQLFWECNEMDACEMYPHGAPEILTRPDFKGFSPGGSQYGFQRLHFKNLDPASVRAEVQSTRAKMMIASLPALPSGPSIDPYYVWNKVLLAYTRCKLSRRHDKLVAISAVARQIQAMANDQYLAGMWRRYLEYHLLWYTNPEDKACHRETGEYVAPSWSWASVTGRVEPYIFIRPNVRIQIQILDVKVTPRTLDAMGQVSSGYLQLRGWLKTFPIERGKQRYKLGLADLPIPQVVDAAQFDENAPQKANEAWFLPVVTLGSLAEHQTLGLILLDTGGKDEYRRVGRFWARDELSDIFRRQPYAHQPSGANISDHEVQEKKGWFGKKKNVGDRNGWKERVFTII